MSLENCFRLKVADINSFVSYDCVGNIQDHMLHDELRMSAHLFSSHNISNRPLTILLPRYRGKVKLAAFDIGYYSVLRLFEYTGSCLEYCFPRNSDVKIRQFYFTSTAMEDANARHFFILHKVNFQLANMEILTSRNNRIINICILSTRNLVRLLLSYL